MRFGVFDHLDRRAGVDPGTFFADRLTLAEEYDRAGFYGYHVAEHHATPLGLAPSPSVFLSALAQRTTRLRFGPLVYLLPLYHPIRLLDEICMLDQMSGGRLMLGVGRGISPIEVGLWGLDPAVTPAMFQEALAILLAGLQTRSLSFEGRYYRFRDYPVELEPVQRPYPPLWYGLARAETVDWCVRHRANVVTNLPLAPTRDIADAYRAAWAAAGHPAETLPLIGFSRHIVIAGTAAEAYGIARRGYARWRESFLHLWLKDGTQMPNLQALFPETFEEAEAQGRAVAGTVGKVRDALARMAAEGGVNYLLCRFAFGDITRDEALQSIRLFTTEVMPAFAEGARE
jgi:alkanesulfonate monooxygenase SsuD/methylene tetrahydromethanopterin reductase-like flavin-dependent oxidoreductase (luciferase family)